MIDMKEFLLQIGAESIPPVVELPTDGTKPRLATLHERLQAEIDSINDQTKELLQSNWPEFESQLTAGQNLLDNIKLEEAELIELESQLTGENAILPPLLAQLSSHSTLALAHSHSEHTLNCVSSILNLHSSILTLSNSISSGALPLAVNNLQSLHTILVEPIESWIINLDAWQSLKQWAKEEELRLETSLINTLEECFEFQFSEPNDDVIGETKCIMQEKVSAAPNGEKFSFETLLNALERMLKGSDKTINSHLAKIAKQVLKHFITPFLESNGKSKEVSGLSWSYEDKSDGIRTVTLKRLSSSETSTTTVIEELETFLSYFASHSNLLPPSHYSTLFTAQLTPSIQSLLVSLHLQASLPPSIALLPPYLTTINSASNFESTFLLNQGYLSFLPQGREIELEEGKIIRDWLERVDLHWARKIGDTTLEKIRLEILTNDWMGEKVELEIVEIELIPNPPPVTVQKIKAPPPPPPVVRLPTPPPPPPPVVEVVVPPIRTGRRILGTRITKPTPIPSTSPSPPPPPTIAPISKPSTPPPNRLTKSLNSTTTSSSSSSLNQQHKALSASVTPSSSSSPIAVRRISKSKAVPRPKASTVPIDLFAGDEEEGEDAWGFGEDEDDEEEAAEKEITPELRKKPSIAVSEDSWGFGAEEEKEKEKVKIVEEKKIKEIPEEVGKVSMDDGWGFTGEESEEKVEKVVPIIEPKVEEGGEAWGFDENEEAEAESLTSPVLDVATISPPPPQQSTSPISSSVSSPSNQNSATPLISTSTASTIPETDLIEVEEEEEPSWGWDEEEGKEERKRAPRVATLPTTNVEGSNGISTGGGGSLRRLEGRRKRKELRMISVKSRSIVETAEKLLVEALEVGGKGFQHPTFATASIPLLKTFVSILSLYRATVSIHHSNLLSSVPAVGMQFANDSEWISEEISKAWRRHSKGKARESSEGIKVEQGLKLVGNLGKEWREKQIAIQRKTLMTTLDEANRFLYTSEDSRYAACEKALAKVGSILENLAEVWKPIMNPSALYTTLGSLVDDVLLRVLNEIEEQADISEVESIRLNKLCKVLHGLESIFLGGPSSVGREVHIWFKFVFLSELLEASMADILFLFDNGHLVDFSTGEIVKLVRALFSDSALRTKNIEHIMSGHPSANDTSSSDDEGWL